ncbi:hypothetical protein F0562_019627 [Nyssa sinensis]|uniref:Uncharacterized protein n=1 Tax=Nyssa sinensis TaxID=561372 RepID=A0A5J5BNW6_9ASTE|nr:hypothetical protein F0562_019627 [Nyssa sinensis]
MEQAASRWKASRLIAVGGIIVYWWLSPPKFCVSHPLITHLTSLCCDFSGCHQLAEDRSCERSTKDTQECAPTQTTTIETEARLNQECAPTQTTTADAELVAPVVDAQVEGMLAGNQPLPAGPLGCRWRARPCVGFQPVGGIIELLAHSLTSIYHRSEETIDDDGKAQHVLQDIKQISYTALEAIRELQRLTVDPAPGSPAPALIPVPPLTRPRGIVARSTAQRTRRGEQSRGPNDDSQGGASTSTSVPSTSSAPTAVPTLHASPLPLPQQFQELSTPPVLHDEDSATSDESHMPTTTILAESTSTVDRIPVVSSHNSPPVSHLTETTTHLAAPEVARNSLREHKVAVDGLAQLQRVRHGRGQGRGNGFNPTNVSCTPSTRRQRQSTPSLSPVDGVSQFTQERRPKPRQQRPKRQRKGTA